MKVETIILLTLSIYGMAIVISFFVALLIKAISVVMNLFEHRQPQAEQEIAPGLSEGISPEVMAVISTAVAVALDKKVRVRRIQSISSSKRSGWTQQGRVTIMTSHSIRH